MEGKGNGRATRVRGKKETLCITVSVSYHVDHLFMKNIFKKENCVFQRAPLFKIFLSHIFVN